METQQLCSTNTKGADEARPRILIVDDASVSLAVLDKVLSKSYDVLQAANGRLALELLRQGDIGLVLTDVQMPEMSGMDLLKAMKRDTALSLIPVVMITADGNSENETKALELGAMDVIRKPFARRFCWRGSEICSPCRRLIKRRSKTEKTSRGLPFRQRCCEPSSTTN